MLTLFSLFYECESSSLSSERHLSDHKWARRHRRPRQLSCHLRPLLALAFLPRPPHRQACPLPTLLAQSLPSIVFGMRLRRLLLLMVMFRPRIAGSISGLIHFMLAHQSVAFLSQIFAVPHPSITLTCSTTLKIQERVDLYLQAFCFDCFDRRILAFLTSLFGSLGWLICRIDYSHHLFLKMNSWRRIPRCY